MSKVKYNYNQLVYYRDDKWNVRVYVILRLQRHSKHSNRQCKRRYQSRGKKGESALPD
ncbi:MAG: hypothetical protein M3R36_17320 [Bacteroidota bacterium]|nr:hypothetical protein [Bacteroidota bacterium]